VEVFLKVLLIIFLILGIAAFSYYLKRQIPWVSVWQKIRKPLFISSGVLIALAIILGITVLYNAFIYKPPVPSIGTVGDGYFLEIPQTESERIALELIIRDNYQKGYSNVWVREINLFWPWHDWERHYYMKLLPSLTK